MGKSSIPGIYGFAQGKVGAVVYSTNSSNLKGERRQIIRLKPTSVKNPRTLAQIIQRMKMGPAAAFFNAFMKLAGSEENNPLSHSFEGIAYGPKSRTRFTQLALSGEPKAYVPNGVSSAVPGLYQVSEGSLPSLKVTGVADDETPSGKHVFGTLSTLSTDDVTHLNNKGIEVGDQLTILGLKERTEGAGIYDAFVGRCVVREGNGFEFINGETVDVEFYDDGTYTDSIGTLACFAVIVSRGVSTNAKRSTAIMQVTENYASLLSPEAYDAAVNSYLTNELFNSLNSAWYLNQGSTQAFNGEITIMNLTLPADTANGVAALTADFIIGKQASGSGVKYVVFMDNEGNSDAGAWTDGAGGAEVQRTATFARVSAALGNVNVVKQYANIDEANAYIAQARGNA